MKTKTALKGLALALPILIAIPTASAQSFVFQPFETEGVSNLDDLGSISLAGHLIDTGSGVGFVVSNDSVPGDSWITDRIPTVTQVFFEDGTGLLFAAEFSSPGSVGKVEFTYREGGTLPGGTNIGFETAFSFATDPPPVVKGVDPNESACFTFEGSDYATVAEAIATGDLRVGLRVQQIGKCGEDSASYIMSSTPIPEPSPAILGGLGLLVLFRRRR